MIRLTTTFDEKDIVKNLGARWNKQEKYWYIDEQKYDIKTFKKWIPADEYTRIVNATTTTLTNFLELIDQNITFKNLGNTYTIEGDIVSVYEANTLTVIELTDTAIGKPTLMVIIPSEKLNNDEIVLVENTRIRVTGSIGIYKKHGKLQVKASSINILHNTPTRRQEQINTWYNELLSAGWNDEVKCDIEAELAASYMEKTNIGVITSQYGKKGYGDFMKTISKQGYSIETIETTLSAANIAAAIEEFDNDDHTEYICILRGGGSSYDLLDFNNPILLDAIYESSIPIITGIGHHDDIPLCAMLADKNYKTPNEVASELNRIKSKAYSAAKNKERNLSFQQRINTIVSSSMSKTEALEKTNVILYQKIDKLSDENAKLTWENEELKTKLANLEAKKEKGFFKRLFGF